MFVIPTLRNTTKLLNTILTRSFCKLAESQNRLKQAIDKELQEENKNIEDLSKHEKFFKAEGWTVSYNNIQVQLKQESKPYEISVLFQARAPPLVVDNSEEKAKKQKKAQQGDIEEETGDEQTEEIDNYSEVKVCIKSANSKRTMIATYCVSQQFGGMLVNIQFANNFDKTKAKNSLKKATISEDYQGPNLASLERTVQELVESFVQYFGMDDQFFKKTFKFGLSYEQKFYIEWLQDLKSLT